MPDPNIRDVVASYGAGLAEARQHAGNRGVELSKLQSKLKEMPRTIEAVMEEFGVDRTEAAETLERIVTFERMVADELELVKRQISYLDQGIRQWNNPLIDEFQRLSLIKNYLAVGTSSDPIAAFESINWTSAERAARETLHDRYQTGMLRVGYGTARFVGSMTGASDMIALVYGVDDEGRMLGWEMRAAALLSMLGGALLSDAATTAHLRNFVTNRNVTHPAKPPRSAPDAAADGRVVATSQTSTLPSGTVADLESMGIPRRNFDKMQQYLFEHNGHVAMRPTGVDAVGHLEAGAKPKPMEVKSKTSKGSDALLGSDPTLPGCAAAFDPKTDFFEHAMRTAGMSDADVVANLDAIRAGETVAAPAGFNTAVWDDTLARFHFRKGEWAGATGDGVRKLVARGDYEIRNGIIWEVNGPNGPRPVTGDHDPFELWIGGRAATAAEEAAFIRAMAADNAGVVHGGHIRFDPQPADYTAGGRFDMHLDPKKYSPEQIEQQVQAKYGADRRIYEDIMEKHSRQALSDDVLRDMEGFETPSRVHYPDGPYGDLRYQQDTALHQRWTDLQAGNKVAPAKTDAEVLVLIGPTGQPLIMRAGETPAGVPKPAAQPIDIGPVAPGSSGTLPRQLLFYGPGVLKTDPIAYDDEVVEWYRLHDGLAASVPLAAVGVHDDTTSPAPAPASGPRVDKKVLVGAGVVLALIAATLVAVARGGGDDGGSDLAVDEPPAVVISDPEPEPESSPETARSVEPASDEPVATPAPVPELVVTGWGIAHGCGVVTHSPSDVFPGSPSWVLLTLLLVQTILAADDGPSAQSVDGDGATVAVAFAGVDVPEATAPVGANGTAGVVLPISSYGPLTMQSIRVTAADGTEYPVDPLADTIVVDASEGPIGGCTPAAELDDQQRQDLLAARFPPSATPADPVADSPSDLAASVDSFVGALLAAHLEGDTAFLAGSLHPAVIDRHGVDACDAYVAATTGSITALEVIDVAPEPWDYPFEGDTVDIAGSITVTAAGTFGGVEQTAVLHVAPVGDQLAWFTNCVTS